MGQYEHESLRFFPVLLRAVFAIILVMSLQACTEGMTGQNLLDEKLTTTGSAGGGKQERLNRFLEYSSSPND